MTQIKIEILDSFNTYSGLDLYEMNLSVFKHYVEQNLHKSIYLFEKEINHNLLVLDVRRLEIYFAQVIHKLENSPFLKFEDSYMDKYIKKYNLDKENILNINNKELISFLNRTGDPFDPLNGPDSDLYFESEKIKSTFYSCVAKHEILFFIDRIKDLREKYIGKPIEKETKQKYTKLYAYELSRYDNLTKEHNYFKYYHSVLLPYISKVKEEVQETILKLDSVKIPLYIDKTIAEIESSGFQNTSLNELDKYVAEYNIDVKKLPEVDNPKLKEILSTKDFRQEMPYKEFSQIEFIQEKFYRYALRKETIKLLGYLKELQNAYQNSKNNTIKIEKVYSYSNTIFTSIEAQQWFQNTLGELNAIDENNKARSGFQAKANAIFCNSTCKKVIFKYGVLLKDFIVFLNKEYKAGIKAKDKLSDGLNHSTAVENLIQLYKDS